MSAPEWLKALGIPESCISQHSSAKEGKCSFTIDRQKLGGTRDEIWRVKVDNCWLPGAGEKKVDYLFWGQSVSGCKVVMLVELKGGHFGKALQQIESTLQRLCKQADGKGIHTDNHRSSPGHDQHDTGGVRAYVVLSKGRGVRQRQHAQERIRQCYGVRVHASTQVLRVEGIDALP